MGLLELTWTFVSVVGIRHVAAGAVASRAVVLSLVILPLQAKRQCECAQARKDGTSPAYARFLLLLFPGRLRAVPFPSRVPVVTLADVGCLFPPSSTSADNSLGSLEAEPQAKEEQEEDGGDDAYDYTGNGSTTETAARGSSCSCAKNNPSSCADWRLKWNGCGYGAGE